jgi:hypothetical protein
LISIVGIDRLSCLKNSLFEKSRHCGRQNRPLNDNLQGNTLEDLKAGYREVGTYDELKHIFEAYLEEHNKTMKACQLVFFDDALEHLLRLLRLLRLPQVFPFDDAEIPSHRSL